MSDILTLEADRRAINITVNSIDTELDLKQRETLYPTIGLLYPEGTSRLARATDLDAVRAAIDAYPDYRNLLTEFGFEEEKSLEDQFFELEVNLNRLAFEQQFHYGMYYAYVKLKEQEIRNIVWMRRHLAGPARPDEPVHQHLLRRARAPLATFGAGSRTHAARRRGGPMRARGGAASGVTHR